jgi:hypothetical protein
VRDIRRVSEDVYNDPIRAAAKIAADVAAIWAVLLEWAMANPDYPSEKVNEILESWHRAFHEAVEKGMRMARQVEQTMRCSRVARQFLLDTEKRDGRG